jgi:hypothetical protein
MGKLKIIKKDGSETARTVIDKIHAAFARIDNIYDDIIEGNCVRTYPSVNEVEEALDTAEIEVPLEKYTVFVYKSGRKKFLIVFDGEHYIAEKMKILT